MRKTIRKQHKQKLTCPHCGQTFQRPQAVASHIRYKHAGGLLSKQTQPRAKKDRKGVIRESLSPSVRVAASREHRLPDASGATTFRIWSTTSPSPVVSWNALGARILRIVSIAADGWDVTVAGDGTSFEKALRSQPQVAAVERRQTQTTFAIGQN
ncbi:MAG: hypothetical protein DMG59_03890 [Acidobacteria bacterium]|nr:MAG: hypothetical protein DMG59_03890 [Acidobacteriota bacterium]